MSETIGTDDTGLVIAPQERLYTIEYCGTCGKVKRITGNYHGELTNGLTYATHWCSCPPVPGGESRQTRLSVQEETAGSSPALAAMTEEQLRAFVREEVRKALADIVRDMHMRGGFR